jgi:hypothetical protein
MEAKYRKGLVFRDSAYFQLRLTVEPKTALKKLIETGKSQMTKWLKNIL